VSLWDFPAGGSVQSGIAAAGGMVCAGSNDERVFALRASDGRQLLSFTADGPVESQIAVAGGIAYFGSEQVYALNGPPT
jgi:outer membrane protein assembly factor BamB